MSTPEPQTEENPLLHAHTRNLEADLSNLQAPSDFLKTVDIQDSNEVNYLTLSNLLEQKQEMSFIQCFEKYYLYLTEQKIQNIKKQEKYASLLITAIENGLNKAVEVILQTKVDVNFEENGITPLAIACLRGNRDALEMLLKHNNDSLKDTNLLISTIMNLHETTEDHDYMGCLEVLLNSPKINVNEVNGLNTSALYFAVQSKNEEAVTKLLEKGAYIGTKDYFNRIPISRINPKILEECFDKCIKTNDACHGDTKFEIIINYTNLLPENSDKNEEIFPVKYIAESEELKYLLNHPLITSFLFLKWYKLSFFFYTNFIISFLFCISLISYILLDFNNAEVETIQTTLMFLSILGLIFIIVRETIQCITLGRELFTISLPALINCVEMALIVLTILTLSQSNFKEEPQRTFAVLTILLVSVEIYLIVGSLPILAIATHMLMLKEVCASFIKSFSQYFIFFVTFGLCFHMVLRRTENPNGRKGFDNDDGYFNSTLGAIFKVFLMVTGELDSGNINFSSSISYGIFLIFVVFMAIVLLNLLNGLAVSDTQMIRAQAELNGSICRTHLLANLEKGLAGRNSRLAFIMNVWPLNSIHKKLTTSFRDYIEGNQIVIRPNDNNKIFITKRPLQHVSIETPPMIYQIEDDESFASPMRNCCGCAFFKFNCSSMDIKIVHAALKVIEKKQQIEKQKQITLEQENRLKNIEQKIHELIMYITKSERKLKTMKKYRKVNRIKCIEKTGQMILSLLQRLDQYEKV